MEAGTCRLAMCATGCARAKRPRYTSQRQRRERASCEQQQQQGRAGRIAGMRTPSELLRAQLYRELGCQLRWVAAREALPELRERLAKVLKVDLLEPARQPRGPEALATTTAVTAPRRGHQRQQHNRKKHELAPE